MAHKITALKVQIEGDDMILTTLTHSPRGTKAPLRQVRISGVHGNRVEFGRKVDTAINELIPFPSLSPA